MINSANTTTTIGGLQASDLLYYEEAQKIWQSKTQQQERTEMDRRFSELWERMRDQEQLLQAAFRHIEELKSVKNNPPIMMSEEELNKMGRGGTR